jgi:hypothetical protein
MKLLTRPLLAAYAIALLDVAACAQHDDTNEAGPKTADADEAYGQLESKLSVDEVGPSLGLQRLFGYDQCTGRIFPPIFDDLIDVSRIPDFFFDRFNKVDVAVSLPQPSVLIGKAGQKEERPSLIQVAGNEKAPLLLVNSDVMLKSGRIKRSPGADFNTALVLFDEKELANLDEHQALLNKAGDLAKEGMVFEGRNPIAKSTTQFAPIKDMVGGRLVAIPAVPIAPTSNETNWLESVMITNEAVVQDEDRTYDPCTDKGNPDGVWTFKHLMTEMANEPRTGITPEDFTLEFLLTWLFPRTINSDTVDDRPAMWSTVIEPWLMASGGYSLDLDKAPFRLLAIVNRLDLRRTTTGGGYFGGAGIPLDAGELRFVFGVVTPPEYSESGTCELLEFTTILEYGVPINGCNSVRNWAREWTKLNIFPAYATAYRNQLASLTEQVVTRDAAPSKGNGSAINQIRTNEIALKDPWEMNEFTLTDEENGNVPVDGMLQLHTVAQTPDDGVYTPTPNPTVSDYIDTIVPPPGECQTNHTVPLEFSGAPFRGGNALVGRGPGSPPGTWFGDGPSTPEYICGRHNFSLNTCNGCHSCDTGTNFTHISPTSGIPAALSGFLTGTSVEDTQFPSDKTWTFADLDRRFQDLYNVADSLCLISPPLQVEMAEIFLERFPDPVFDPAEAIKILNEVERAALERLPKDAQPDPNMGVLLSDIGHQNLNASH